jgi:hypothetical protein
MAQMVREFSAVWIISTVGNVSVVCTLCTGSMTNAAVKGQNISYERARFEVPEQFFYRVDTILYNQNEAMRI